ncbi:MAG: FeoA family protein [Bacteroidota bacterium]
MIQAINSIQNSAKEVALSEFSVGDEGVIGDITSQELALGLLKMGIQKGDRCKLANIAPLGNPLAILVNGTKISIRNEDAARIRMQIL